MKTQMVQIEAVDSLESLVEKISQARTVRVLVLDQGDNPIPRDEVLTRVLIRRCLHQGKQIGFVTRDREAGTLWTSLEVSVFPDVVTAEHEIWQTISISGQVEKRLPRKTTLPTEVKDRKPELSKGLSQFWRVSIFTIAILSVVGLIACLLPSSDVIITMPRMDAVVEYPVQLSTTFTQVSLSGQIPAREYQYPFAVIQSIPSTGKMVLDDQFATGEVVITGNNTKETIRIPEGTVLSPTTDLMMQYKTTVVASLESGKNASVVVPVIAQSPGATGNLPANIQFSLPAEVGTSLKTTNPDPFTGGGSNEFPSPSDADRILLREMVENQIEQQGVEKVVSESSEHVWMVPGTYRVVRSDFDRFYPANGESGETLTLEASGTASVLVVNQQDLIRYIEKVAEADTLSSERLLPGSIEISGLVSNATISGEENSAILSASLTRIPKADTGKIPYQIAGKLRSQVEEYIREQVPAASTVRIENQPAWWPWAAALPMQIQVEVR